MRMWMLNPTIMCLDHRLGEHYEIHMFVGHMRRERSIEGYVRNNCIQPRALKWRHDQIAQSLPAAPLHHSPLSVNVKELIAYLPFEHQRAKVNVEQAFEDLINRCPKCYEKAMAQLKSI
jgi:hypothetical protein